MASNGDEAKPGKKTKYQLQQERLKDQEQVKTLLEKYDNDKNQSLQETEIRKVLTDMDGSPPLDRDVRWVMRMGDKDGSGSVSAAELYVVLPKYKKYRTQNPSLSKLIALHDKNQDGQLSDKEMKALLSDCVEKDVTDEDVQYVMQKFQEFSEPGVSGIPADSLSKAISAWEDEQSKESHFFDFLPAMPAMSMPQMEPPDLSGAQQWATGVFGCCSGDRKEVERKDLDNNTQGHFV